MPSKNQLKDKLRTYGLKVSGNKQDLIERIDLHEKRLIFLNNLVSKSSVDTHTVSTNTDIEEGQCAICLTELSTKTAKTTLECTHSFCTTCILRWFRTNNTCPCCRSEVANVIPRQDNSEVQRLRRTVNHLRNTILQRVLSNGDKQEYINTITYLSDNLYNLNSNLHSLLMTQISTRIVREIESARGFRTDADIPTGTRDLIGGEIFRVVLALGRNL